MVSRLLIAAALALGWLLASPVWAQQATPYLVKPTCMPVVQTPGWVTVNEEIKVNTVGVCVKWECLPSTWRPGEPFRIVTYCGPWAEAARASPRVDTIRKAVDPLKSLQDAGKRFTIVPLDDPSMAGLPK